MRVGSLPESVLVLLQRRQLPFSDMRNLNADGLVFPSTESPRQHHPGPQRQIDTSVCKHCCASDFRYVLSTSLHLFSVLGGVRPRP